MYLKISFRTEPCFGCRSSGCLFMRSSPLMPSWEAAVWWTWTLSVKDVPKEPANKTSSFVNTEWTKPPTSSIRYQSSRKSLKIANLVSVQQHGVVSHWQHHFHSQILWPILIFALNEFSLFSRYVINTKSYCFDKYEKRLNPKRTYSVSVNQQKW